MKSLIIKGKKGEERILFSFMVAVWFLIGLGVMLGIYISYGDESDVKQLQAGILADKIAGCLIDNSKLIDDITKDEFDIIDKCNFNKEVITGSKFYSQVKFNYISEGKIGDEFRKPIIIGNKDALTQCSLRESNIPGTHYFRCIEKKYYAFSKDDKLVLIDIYMGANNEGGRF